MKKMKVYIETSIPSYLTGWVSTRLIIAARQAMTQLWWNERERYDLYISECVLEEVRKGDLEAARLRIAAIAGIPNLPITPEAIVLSEKLIRDFAIPKERKADADHLAVAAVHGMDVLLTWNQKHLSGIFLRKRLDAAITAAGFSAPVIARPDDFRLKEEKKEMA